jgi:hypothetical protein
MENVLQLKPEQIDVTENGARFDMSPSRVESLAESILSEGGVLQPVGVLAGAKGKHTLIYGFHRVAAVDKLNKEQGAGLTVPAVALSREDATALLKTQIAENNERESMSPMDKAVAMKGLMDKGIARGEVRRIFAVPGGSGRKGSSIQPMSNAMLNIHLRFLELPKSFQEKIHSGRLTWAAAYELGRVTPDRRADVLRRAEAEVDALESREEQDEQRYLKTEKRLVEAEQVAAASESELERAKSAVVNAAHLIAEKTEAYRAVQKEVGDVVLDKKATDKDKKLAAEKLKAAEADVTAATKEAKAAKNEVAKFTKKKNNAAERAEEVKAKLEAARKALKNKPVKPAVGPKGIKEAAKAEGVETGAVPLTLQDIRELLKDGRTQSEYPKVAAIFKYLTACIDGVTVPKECIGNIALMTGERKVEPKTQPKK